MTEPISLLIRNGKEEDIPFIYSTWLRGLYYGNEWFKQIPTTVYYPTYHEVIERLLKRDSVTVSVAAFEDDPDCILGYAITELKDDKTILHWVFVKYAWRYLGIARKLIPPTVHVITHLTKAGKAMKPVDADFNPFLI